MLQIQNFKWIKVFRRLFDIKEDGLPNNWSMSPVIQPVLTLDERPTPNHLKLLGDIQGVAGTYVSFYAPDYDEVVDITGCYREGTTANSKIAISDGTNVIEVTASTTSATAYSGFKIRLIKGWSIGMFATGNAGDAARYLHIICEIQTRKLDRGSSTYYAGDLSGGAF